MGCTGARHESSRDDSIQPVTNLQLLIDDPVDRGYGPSRVSAGYALQGKRSAEGVALGFVGALIRDFAAEADDVGPRGKHHIDLVRDHVWHPFAGQFGCLNLPNALESGIG